MKKTYTIFICFAVLITALLSFGINSILSLKNENKEVSIAQAAEIVAKAIAEEKYTDRITENTLYSTMVWTHDCNEEGTWYESSIVFNPDESMLDTYNSREIQNNADVKISIYTQSARIYVKELH